VLRNVEMDIKDSILILKIDLSKSFGPSKTKKSIIVATTEGNVELQPGVMVGLNVFKPNRSEY
jgi:hypothetical protein